MKSIYEEILSLPECNFPFWGWKWGLLKDTMPTGQQQNELKCNPKKALVGRFVCATYTFIKKVFEELRFGQVREEGAGHTGTGYEGHDWLLQTVDTDTDHHVRKKTLHPLGMNRQTPKEKPCTKNDCRLVPAKTASCTPHSHHLSYTNELCNWILTTFFRIHLWQHNTYL